MAAASPNKCHMLAELIAALLRDKMQAGPDVMDYIDSTYGYPDVEKIRSLINEPGGSDRETLVELLFFPDPAVQLQLEEALQAHTCTSEDVETIAAELAQRNILATISLDNTGRTLRIRADRTVIDTFLARLNMTYAPDADLMRTVVDVLPADRQKAVGVRFRNTRIQPTGQWLEFLQCYIRIMHADRFFFEGLDFLLAFMQEIDRDADIYEVMMKKKRSCWRHLNSLEAVEEKLKKSNVEILLLQGERLPYIDQERTRQTIAAIDRICLAVFGKTETIAAANRDDAGWEIGSLEDAAAMIRRLTS